MQLGVCYITDKLTDCCMSIYDVVLNGQTYYVATKYTLAASIEFCMLPFLSCSYMVLFKI